MSRGSVFIECVKMLTTIVVLIALVVPLLLNLFAFVKASQVAQNFRNIKTAVENYINIEKPSVVSDINLLNLVAKGYLSKLLSGFQVRASFGNDAYDVTIYYTDADVQFEKVRLYYPEVSEHLKLSFRVKKWW